MPFSWLAALTLWTTLIGPVFASPLFQVRSTTLSPATLTGCGSGSAEVTTDSLAR